jgi:hypothetical protein
MNRNFEIITALQYRVKSLASEVDSFKSGKKFTQIKEQFRLIALEKDRIICRLNNELATANAALVSMRENWFLVTADIEKEHKKELSQKDNEIKKLEKRAIKAENERDEAKDKYREKNKELYAALTGLEEEKGKNQKLTIQLNRDYENSSLSSSSKPFRKKIVNSREKTGRKPGGQPGHEPHLRKKQKPSNIILIKVPGELLDADKYKPTGGTISKQVVNLRINLVTDEYTTPLYREIKTGKLVHAPFPAGITLDVNYGGSVKAFAFMLNNYCNISIDKVRDFISGITGGRLSISKGMINGLSEEFSLKSEEKKLELIKDLLSSPVINTDFSGVNLNGKNANILVMANENEVMFFARKSKGHKGIIGTPLEDYLNTMVHDHDKTFYSYGSNHGECNSHVLRYLKSSIENEPHLEWNKRMQNLLREMIHYRNGLPDDATRIEPGIIGAFEDRYLEILDKAKEEYEYTPPSAYYRDGFNLSKRLLIYKDNHLLFLNDLRVPATNNLAERLLRLLKRKSKQVMAFRSFESIGNLCSSLGVIISLRPHSDNLYEDIASIFD